MLVFSKQKGTELPDEREAAPEEFVEGTVWNQGNIELPSSSRRASQVPVRAFSEEGPHTAVVAVQIQRPEDLGIDSQSRPQEFGQAPPSKDVLQSGSDMSRRLAEALADMPAAGSDLFGFKILADLGRGAFGRVYLAQQCDLASRFVALKVSTNLFGESQALAQLQHTNIVPIYSIHRAALYQAVCMPYFGSTTLSDLLKHWRQRESLPETGLELVHTLCSRKSSTREMYEQESTPACSNVAAPEPLAKVAPEMLPQLSKGQGTAILDMLQGLSYVHAILWIAARLANGLAHAHERGILHRDLKPANVLLTDEGQPMLLDFSVAEDTKLRKVAAIGHVGGTLNYMAPEHLEAFQGAERLVDARSDLYSLGIILFEMLTRREPFPALSGTLHEVLPSLLEARKAAPPYLRCWNKSVSPAVESIVRHCLEPDPAKRYQSAHELHEDLDRQRVNLPLKYAPEPSLRERSRKWIRRHPRLTSVTSMIVLGLVLVSSAAGWTMVRGQRLAEFEAQESFNRFHEEAKSVQFLLNARSMDTDQLVEGLKQGQKALGTYAVLDNPEWAKQPAVRQLSAANQTKLRSELEDLLLLMSRATLLRAAARDASAKGELLECARSWNQLAATLSPYPQVGKALLGQRAEIELGLGRITEARQLREQIKGAKLESPRDHYQAGSEAVALGRYQEALPLLQYAAEAEPQNFWYRLILGLCYDGLEQPREARGCYTTSIALWPEFPWTYFNRGLVYLRQYEYQKAIADFNRMIQLRPNFAEVYMNRAVAWEGLKNYQAAIADLTHALELGAPCTRIYFMRAHARTEAGDKEGAKQDMAEGLRREPSDEKSWVARGWARLASDLLGALKDFEKAGELNPRYLPAMQNQAYVLGKLGRNQEAVAVLDREIEMYPDYVPARAGRGVMLARLHKRQAAHEDASEALRRDFGPATQYQVAGIFALTSREEPNDRAQALLYLAAALRKGFGFEMLEQDEDLDPIRDRPEFRQLVLATKTLQSAAAKSSKDGAKRNAGAK
jgi:eukaryotic-like serine/threonine-protein kinase